MLYYYLINLSQDDWISSAQRWSKFATIMKSVLLIRVSFLITRWVPRLNTMIVPRPRTADSTIAEVMAGVRVMLPGLTTGSRLILTEQSKCVVLLHRGIMAALFPHGSKASSCLFLLMEAIGRLMRMQIMNRWVSMRCKLYYAVYLLREEQWVTRCQ